MSEPGTDAPEVSAAPQGTRSLARPWPRVARWGAWVLLLALFVGHVALLQQPFEDAYITFRYADHLASGVGPVFNAGERVEGYTCFLWMAVLALARAIGLPLVATSIVLGALAGVALLLLTQRLGRAMGLSSRGAAAATALLAVNPTIATWAGSGMETALFGLTTCAALYVAIVAPQRVVLTGVLAALATLTRPEGVLVLVVIVVAQLAQRRALAAVLKLLFSFGVLYGPYFAWRVSYYGWLLPNTFYAKVSTDGGLWPHGLREVGSFFGSYGLWLLIPPLGIMAARRKLDAADKLLLGYVALVLLSIVLVGGDIFHGYRFFYSILPPMMLLLLRSLQHASSWRVVQDMSPAVRRLVVVLGGVLLALFVFTAFAQRRSPWEPGEATINEGIALKVHLTAQYFDVARFLQKSFPAGTSIALNAVGVIPFLTGFATMDMLGLNDAHIAHRRIPLGQGFRGHEKHDAAYVLSRKPDVVILGLPGLNPAPLDSRGVGLHYGLGAAMQGDADMLKNPSFAADYHLANVPLRPRGYLTFFVRKGVRARRTR